MKRISKIELENSRAYFNRQVFSLEKGENLLLYGENGSGKTSLYKSLKDFIQSFYAPVDYTPNRYKAEGELGEVVLSIGDYDEAAQRIDNVVELRLARGVDNTQVADTPFMKSLALTRGFLNYRDLLKVYLYEEKDPNLFGFFIEHLLANYVPVAQGRKDQIKNEWDSINNLLFDVHDRRTRDHRRGRRLLEEFEDMLRSVLDNLFEEVNRYLAVYFKTLELTISYDLKPMSFLYHDWKWQWVVVQDLRLKIDLGHLAVADYTEGLNEARLSAIAICLYLAALHFHPGQDLRLMFLDDIFIGIDSANRWPILEILDKEFRDFQIIIATYDRSWYCLARNYLLRHKNERWKTINLYSMPKIVNGQTIFVPILTEGRSDFDKAKEYLHGQRPIDLPAAANYFRKALEDILSDKNLPKELFMSEDYSMIPGYKLTSRVNALSDLFIKIGEDTKYIQTIEAYLHPLIHPLSHYEEEAQIYRRELLGVEEAISGLHTQVMDYQKRCKLLLGKGNKVVIDYNTADGSYCAKYYILFDDNVWAFKDNDGVGHFTEAECHCAYIEEFVNGVKHDSYSPKEGNANFETFCYKSLSEALQKSYDYLVNVEHHPVVAHNDYNIVFMVSKAGLESFAQKRDEVLASI